MTSLAHLLQLVEVLREIGAAARTTAPDGAAAGLAEIERRVRAALAALDLRACRDCRKTYLHDPGSRHYRCGTCRWKRHLLRQCGSVTESEAPAKTPVEIRTPSAP